MQHIPSLVPALRGGMAVCWHSCGIRCPRGSSRVEQPMLLLSLPGSNPATHPGQLSLPQKHPPLPLLHGPSGDLEHLLSLRPATCSPPALHHSQSQNSHSKVTASGRTASPDIALLHSKGIPPGTQTVSCARCVLCGSFPAAQPHHRARHPRARLRLRHRQPEQPVPFPGSVRQNQAEQRCPDSGSALVSPRSSGL